MLTDTLFIVGAGASAEVGLPTGEQLIRTAVQRLSFAMQGGTLDRNSGDLDILDMFQQYEHAEGILNYIEASRRFREGVVFSKSIDAFLDVHADDEVMQRCGKLAIAKSIMEAELQSACALDEASRMFNDETQVKKSWLMALSRNLNEGIRKPEIHRVFGRVSFIVFNYDRCLEHYLFHQLRRLYGIEEDKSQEIMQSLRVIHPYGTIGDLPWQRGKDTVPFGWLANRAALEIAMPRIKTFTEQSMDAGILSAIHEEVRTARTIVFLGFSFHPENMRLLTPGCECNADQIYGTALGMPPGDVEIVQQTIRNLAGKSLVRSKSVPMGGTGIEEAIYLQAATCSDLIQNNPRSLFTAKQAT
jgi:hypothetical protein